MKYLFFILLITISQKTYSQHNMLGKTGTYVGSYYNINQKYSVKVDTISTESIMLTCRTQLEYPYYTYEIDLKSNICISYGIVSKERRTLDNYFEILDYLGELVKVDSTFSNFTYKIEKQEKDCYYTIKQLFKNSSFISRRNIFYIIVTEQEKRPY